MQTNTKRQLEEQNNRKMVQRCGCVVKLWLCIQLLWLLFGGEDISLTSSVLYHRTKSM